jgi:hypothetical protein
MKCSGRIAKTNQHWCLLACESKVCQQRSHVLIVATVVDLNDNNRLLPLEEEGP